MAALRIIASRIGTKRTVVTGAVVASVAALLLATEVPSALLPAGGGSAALAELLARSPGMRVGGVALKAKQPRASLASVATDDAPAAPGRSSPTASVLGAAAPEGPVPESGTLGPGGFPTDFIGPSVPSPIAGAPDFGSSGGPGVIGVPIFGGGGGGGGSVTPTPTETPPVTPTPNPTDGTPVPQPTPTTPDVVPGVPEPSTWLMLIGGFGIIGGAMRRRRREAFA